MSDCNCPQCAAYQRAGHREILLLWLNAFLLGCLIAWTWWRP